MSAGYIVLIILSLSVILSGVAFFLGMRTQRRADVDVYLSRMRKIQEAQERAKESIAEELSKATEKRAALSDLEWKELLRRVRE